LKGKIREKEMGGTSKPYLESLRRWNPAKKLVESLRRRVNAYDLNGHTPPLQTDRKTTENTLSLGKHRSSETRLQINCTGLEETRKNRKKGRKK